MSGHVERSPKEKGTPLCLDCLGFCRKALSRPLVLLVWWRKSFLESKPHIAFGWRLEEAAVPEVTELGTRFGKAKSPICSRLLWASHGRYLRGGDGTMMCSLPCCEKELPRWPTHRFVLSLLRLIMWGWRCVRFRWRCHRCRNWHVQQAAASPLFGLQTGMVLEEHSHNEKTRISKKFLKT